MQKVLCCRHAETPNGNYARSRTPRAFLMKQLVNKTIRILLVPISPSRPKKTERAHRYMLWAPASLRSYSVIRGSSYLHRQCENTNVARICVWQEPRVYFCLRYYLIVFRKGEDAQPLRPRIPPVCNYHRSLPALCTSGIFFTAFSLTAGNWK